MPQDVPADPPALLGARLLVAPEVDAAVDPGIVDIVGDLFPGGVIQDHARGAGLLKVMVWPPLPKARSSTARATPDKLAWEADRYA
jgi:hypothetical protein